MNADFHRATGEDLLVTSGIRLRTEQEAIFKARYVPASQVNGRRVYDYRWYQGILWARISAAGTVAAPDSAAANHVLENSGAGAVDLRDTGSDRGVTTAGTPRANWLKANAHKYNYTPEGYNFGEAWHYKYLGDPWRAVATQSQDEVEEISKMAEKSTETFIISYSSKNSRNGIVLASLNGKWKKLTSEQWRSGTIQHMLRNLEIIKPGNDREYDIIRAMCK